jgi:tetratricopeptide (TPR) repeat protein
MNVVAVHLCANLRALKLLFASGTLACVLAIPNAAATCIAPGSMHARLQNHPTQETLAILGSWYGDRKQFECAAHAFAAAQKLQPDSAFLAYMWGLSLYSAGKGEEALPPLEISERLNSSDVKPHLVLGAALDSLNQTAKAETEWRAVLALAPDSTPALDALSRDLLLDKDYTAVIALLENPATANQRSPLQSLNLGMAYAKAARVDQAGKVLREAVNTAPDSLPLANELAVVLVLLSRSEEATAVLEVAMHRHPNDLNTKVLYLRTLLASNSPKVAVFGHKLLLTSPHNWEVLYLNGAIEMTAGKLQEARALLEKSVALRADYMQSQSALGQVLMQLKDLPAAREHLERAISLGDTEPDVRYNLAKVLRSLGKVEESQIELQAYQRLKKSQSDRTQAAGRAEMADQALAAGQLEQAITLYREAIASDPGEALLAYKLALALDKANDPVGEKAALEQALQLKPDLAEGQNQMGYLASRDGDSAHAEGFFRAAIHASPSYAVAWINLAATLASEAKWRDAKQAVIRALEIDPNNTKAQQLDQAIGATPSQQ